MDPTGITNPILRIQSLSAYQGSSRQQQAPFTQGQMLQGLVSAKNGTNQFTIDIGGRQVQAESTAQLQVGQTLHLQVAALTPQVELQIVRSNPINSMIGNAIHLIGQQTATFPALTNLAETSEQLPQLSTDTKATLQFYAGTVTDRLPGTTSAALQNQVTVQLINRAFEILAAQPNSKVGPTYAAIGDLLQQLSQTSTLSTTTAEHAGNLATIFSQLASLQPSTNVPGQRETAAALLAGTNSEVALMPPINTVGSGDQLIQNLLSQLTPLLQENTVLPADHPLRQLLAFLVSTQSETALPQSLQMDGTKLQEFIDRLGVNMEQLLAGNNREKAVQTLKYALLEFSQQVPSSGGDHDQAEQLVKSIELYQLLQIRLASESLFFLPLPFSFLEQGYLLVNTDHSKNGSEENTGSSEQAVQHFELHLQLEGLGNLQIDLHQSDGGITLKFMAEDTERAKYLAGFREELGQWLTAVDLESAQFLVGAKEPAKSLLEKIVHGATGMVDTQA
ncbi:MAG: flagellar hook-length control protein FliK [Desulfobulbaceae bacterium]|nr:flagellar hook-length control protein FliK [Desulfobulbaceae bacterium]